MVHGTAAVDRRSVRAVCVSDTISRTGPEWAKSNGDTWAELWEHTDRGLQGLSSYLLSAALESLPKDGFRAFEVGCGAGSTAIALADARPDASIIACDISPALVRVARSRTADKPNIEVVLGDAEAVAGKHAPYDLIYSRHGVMFFPEPVQAFRHLRDSASPGASIVFSCFQEWQANPWASELAAAAAGQTVPPPGRAPSGFAFADPDYVMQILTSAGWSDARPRAVNFNYVAGTVESAMTMMTRIGPAASVLASLPEDQREGARDRMLRVLDAHFDGTTVSFPAAAWIWSARAGSA